MPQISVSSNFQEAYDEQYNKELSQWRELGAKYKAANIVIVCGDRTFRRVLEVGAGDGSILMHLSQQNFAPEFHAIEISQSGVERIIQRQIPTLSDVRLFDGYNIPASDNIYDLTILSHVLEHVEFPRLLLREIKRVSQYQVIEIPIEYQPDVDQNVPHFLSYGHISVYTPSLLRFLLKTEGFEIIAHRLTRSSRELMEYNYYVNAKKPKNWRSILRFEAIEKISDLRWRSANRTKRELMCNAYTVLCTRSENKFDILSQ